MHVLTLITHVDSRGHLLALNVNIFVLATAESSAGSGGEHWQVSSLRSTVGGRGCGDSELSPTAVQTAPNFWCV